MALTKSQKQKVLEDLKEKIEKQKSIAFLNISGVKVKDLSRLRTKMKENDCQLKVAKKTLIEKAFKEKGVDIETKKIEGEIALAFGFKDEVLPFKISYDFSKEIENLKILGGFFEGKIISKAEALTLATLPTKEELLVKLLGSISSPLSNLISVLEGNLRGLIFVLSAIKK